MFLGCCGTSSGMDGGGGGGDNAKIPLLMDCISSFKLLSFVVSLSDASLLVIRYAIIVIT